jgi:formylglycine-generating enzyme required for sulfatase activity/uncharacterized caspase-like protein
MALAAYSAVAQLAHLAGRQFRRAPRRRCDRDQPLAHSTYPWSGAMRFRSAIVLTLFLSLIVCMSIPAHAEKRVALVIGNASYKNAATLQNPRNDAQDVSAALQRLGFETIVGLDLDKAGMEEKSIAFVRVARDSDVALVYYSGHAMQFGGFNYLMPVDAALHDDADLRRLTRVDDIVADLKQAKHLRILILDACRVNPLAEELSRLMELTRGPLVDRGLARIIAARGMIISYATQAGQTAADGEGHNSPYTMAFLKNIETADEISTIFRHITADVDTATQSKQLPELSLSVVGDFYLNGRPETMSQAQLESGQPATHANEAERAWTAMQGTTSQEVVEDFIKRYGDSFYGTLARVRLEELKKVQTEALAQVQVPSNPNASSSPSTVSSPPTGSAAGNPPQQVAVVAPPATAPSASPADAGLCGSATVTASSTSRSPRPLSAAEECAFSPKAVFRECEKCPEMVVVPPGSFTMGSPSSEPERDNNEGQVRVTMAKPFAVGKYPVTFDEWDACVADGGCGGYRPDDEGWGRGRRPAINVSWDDSQKYVSWINGKTGKTYRLLSEAEREYVTRAGTTTPFWWGSSISPTQANYDGKAGKKTVPVDSFAANPWGLYQVHGNMWEWTQDCWNASNSGNPGDGGARTIGHCSSRVLRGGSWHDFPRYLRAASRGWFAYGSRDYSIGFRVARTLTP